MIIHNVTISIVVEDNENIHIYLKNKKQNVDKICFENNSFNVFVNGNCFFTGNQFNNFGNLSLWKEVKNFEVYIRFIGVKNICKSKIIKYIRKNLSFK